MGTSTPPADHPTLRPPHPPPYPSPLLSSRGSEATRDLNTSRRPPYPPPPTPSVPLFRELAPETIPFPHPRPSAFIGGSMTSLPVPSRPRLPHNPGRYPSPHRELLPWFGPIDL